MTLILDAAPLVALADAEEPQLEALLRIRDEEEGPWVLPAPVAAEVDYLLGVRFGHAARRAFLSDLAAWRYDVACLEDGDYRVVAELDARYSDLGLGLAECSIAVPFSRHSAASGRRYWNHASQFRALLARSARNAAYRRMSAHIDSGKRRSCHSGISCNRRVLVLHSPEGWPVLLGEVASSQQPQPLGGPRIYLKAFGTL